MQKDIKDIKEDIKEIKDVLMSLETRFADKWVERTVTIFVSLLVMSAIYVIFNHVGLPTQ